MVLPPACRCELQQWPQLSAEQSDLSCQQNTQFVRLEFGPVSCHAHHRNNLLVADAVIEQDRMTEPSSA